MRKLYLLSLLLPLWTLLPLWGQGGCLFAAVQVQNISTDYANKRVTFALSWAAGTRNATHNSKVWVFVDYQPVTGLTTGAWQRATVNLSALPAGCTADGSNTRGFWYQGQATAAQNANITVTLTNMPAQFNWCAYATDYPPNAKISGNSYTLHGTAPFTVNGTQLAAGVRTYSSACITSITDPTGCPGLIPAAPTVTTTNPAAICAGSGVTLTATPGGGTTTANTYTWNIGGASTTTTTNTFAVPAASITTSKTFTVSVRNANGCTSNTVSGNITVISGCGSGNGTNVTNCSNPPSGFSFTSGFVSGTTWVVGSQTWSAPVTATYCRKTAFNGGNTGAYLTDCRSANTSSSAIHTTYGDLFSWCMVAKFATTICPSGWRVPTGTDFCNLDKTLFSTSTCTNRTNASNLSVYMGSRWGGQYAGYAYSGAVNYQTSTAYYWSQTETTATAGYTLYLTTGGYVYPQYNLYKTNGATLRCVK